MEVFKVKGKDLINPNFMTAMNKLMTSSHYKNHKHSHKVSRLASLLDGAITEFRTEMKEKFTAAAKDCGVDAETNGPVTPELEKRSQEIRDEMESKEYEINWHQLGKEDISLVKFTPAELEAIRAVSKPSYFSGLESQ